MAMLEIRDLKSIMAPSTRSKISFDVNQGEVIALDRCQRRRQDHDAAHHHRTAQGEIRKCPLEGKELTKLPPHKIVAMGMAHVPEGRRIFQQLSVFKNLDLGAYTRRDREKNTRATWRWYMKSSRVWKNAKTRSPERCPAANSRCWRWEGR